MMDDSEVDVAMESDSSIGEAVSGRGQNESYEEDLYYIPERRPSLDLGPSPMDTSHWNYVDQALSPALSYNSMTSEGSLSNMDSEDRSSTRIQLSRADSYSSCYSLDSNDCEKIIPKLKCKDETALESSETPETPETSETSETSELIQDPNEIKQPSLTVAFTFKAISNTLGKLNQRDMKKFKTMLWKHHLQSFNTPSQSMDLVDLVDRLLECFSLEVSLQITKTRLEEMGQKKLVEYLQTLCMRNEVRHDLCETLKRTYGEVCEDSAMQGEKRPFDEVFTDLCITSTSNNGPNIEHEVLTIEKLDSNKEAETQISMKSILDAESVECSNLKFMLITGVAGSGKSMMVRRLILDWIEERSHQHVSFLFPLPFRELKQFEESNVSLVEILEKLYPETQKLREEDYRSEDCKMMFIFDGLDEYKEKLDFQNTALLSDHRDATTLNAIVVNLLRARLLYRGLFLVFSRPQVKRCVPWDMHYHEVEVRGFCDPQKDEYFKKRFKDPDQAAQVIAYINSSKTLRIMCHLPLFCSVVADEYQHIFKDQVTQVELPRSITYMYTKLLFALTRHHRKLRAPDRSLDEERDFLMKLGKLAFNMMEQGQFKITKSDWKQVGIEAEEAVINSGLCTQYITEPYVLVQEKVLSFIHPTMQEYLAALYVFLTFTNQGKNKFEKNLKNKVIGIFRVQKAIDLYKSAVERSLLCDDGKLDIFLRFLLGMALQSNLELLQPFFTSSEKWPTVIENAAAFIRKTITENQYPGRNSNLQCCLKELGVKPPDAASS